MSDIARGGGRKEGRGSPGGELPCMFFKSVAYRNLRFRGSGNLELCKKLLMFQGFYGILRFRSSINEVSKIEKFCWEAPDVCIK